MADRNGVSTFDEVSYVPAAYQQSLVKPSWEIGKMKSDQYFEVFITAADYRHGPRNMTVRVPAATPKFSKINYDRS